MICASPHLANQPRPEVKQLLHRNACDCHKPTRIPFSHAQLKPRINCNKDQVLISHQIFFFSSESISSDPPLLFPPASGCCKGLQGAVQQSGLVRQCFTLPRLDETVFNAIDMLTKGPLGIRYGASKLKKEFYRSA